MIERIGSVRSYRPMDMAIWGYEKSKNNTFWGIPDSWMTMGYDQNRPILGDCSKQWLFPARDDRFFWGNQQFDPWRCPFLPTNWAIFLQQAIIEDAVPGWRWWRSSIFSAFFGWSQLKMNLSPPLWEFRIHRLKMTEAVHPRFTSSRSQTAHWGQTTSAESGRFSRTLAMVVFDGSLGPGGIQQVSLFPTQVKPNFVSYPCDKMW